MTYVIEYVSNTWSGLWNAVSGDMWMHMCLPVFSPSKAPKGGILQMHSLGIPDTVRV